METFVENIFEIIFVVITTEQCCSRFSLLNLLHSTGNLWFSC